MYILYRILYNGRGLIWPDKEDFTGYVPMPSECTWIVPGTIDPKDD